MSDFEKKIEEAAENFKLSDIPYPPLKNIFKAGCKHGYTLGREEIIGLLNNSNGGYWNPELAEMLEEKFNGIPASEAKEQE